MGTEAVSGLSTMRARGERARRGEEARRRARPRPTVDPPVPSTMDDGTSANSGDLVITSGRAPLAGAFATKWRAAGSGAVLMADDTTLTQLVGHNIRLARESAGLSQEVLAHKIGLDRRHISRWERGVVRPSDRNLGLLADALGVGVPWLHGEHDAA